MKHIVSNLQRMIEYKDISEDTVAWDHMHELLQIARDITKDEETRGGR